MLGHHCKFCQHTKSYNIWIISLLKNRTLQTTSTIFESHTQQADTKFWNILYYSYLLKITAHIEKDVNGFKEFEDWWSYNRSMIKQTDYFKAHLPRTSAWLFQQNLSYLRCGASSPYLWSIFQSHHIHDRNQIDELNLPAMHVSSKHSNGIIN